MISFLWSKIFGKCIAGCNPEDSEKFIEVVRSGRFTTDTIRIENGRYTVTFPESKLHIAKKMLSEAEIDFSIERLSGIPRLVYRYRHRPGIILGAVIFFIIIGISSRVIWDFEITGNKNISDTEIIEALEARGCKAGSFYSDINFSMVQNDCLIDAKELAWVSVNMDGNLARVEVREKRSVPMGFIPEKGRFANIIAAEDGVIEICRVRSGKAQVEQGTVVKKGELLITGVIDVGETEVRFEYADGEVLARVYREIESYIPFERQIKVPTGAEKSEIQLKIFGKTINLSSRGSIDYELYGKIIENEKLSLPFGITLPMWKTKTVYSEMREETKNISEEEALLLARADVSAKLSEMADTLQILSVSESTATDENGVKVTLGVYGVTDISANYGFSVADIGTEEKEDNQKE